MRPTGDPEKKPSRSSDLAAIAAGGGKGPTGSPVNGIGASAGADSPPPGEIRDGPGDHETEPADPPSLPLTLLSQEEETTSPDDDAAIRKILKLLRIRTGHDFTHYKHSSTRRAIQRRMDACSIDSLAGYVKRVRTTPAELESLFDGLLVRVTWFFRDPDAFGVLAECLSRTLLAQRSAEDPFRVWVTGCSTGEEAYSIAILVTEIIENLGLDCRLKVFASDIDPAAVATARTGIYPDSISEHVSPERLARHFSALPGGGYCIGKSIRDGLVFSVHSLIKDPPFSKLDLVVCRNLLIYLDAAAHKRTFSLFHFVLKPAGILMLGSAESPGAQHALFATLDRRASIFQRKETRLPERLAWIRQIELSPPSQGGVGALPVPRNLPLADSPAAPPPEATGGSGKAQPEHGPASRAGLKFTIATLQRELRAQELVMQMAVGELRVTNEGLICSNEEQQCMIEELQSTSDEIAASKDQLRSLNDDLAVLNAELVTRMADLAGANDDLKNLLDCTGVGTVFVDPELRIIRFNSLVSRILNLIPGDIGRPMWQISSNLSDCADLAAEVGEVLKRSIGHEREVVTRNGLSFLMRIHPYCALAGEKKGAVISFTEITEMVGVRESLKTANRLKRLAVVVHDARDAVVMQDLEGHILAWNPAAVANYGWTEAEALLMNVHEIIPEDRHQQELEIVAKLGCSEIIEPYVTRRLTRAGALVPVSLIATALVNATGEVYAISTTERMLKGAMP